MAGLLAVLFFIGIGAPADASGAPAVPLSPQETAWLAAHPTVRMGVDPEFVPFEFIDDNGNYLGMCAEYVRLLSQRLDIEMQVTPGLTWNEAVERAKAGKIDVLPCVGMTEERKKYFLYSEPYLSFYRVIITPRDAAPIDSLDALRGLRVAVQGNSSHHGFLMDNSDIEPLLFETAEDTLLAVSRGEADVAIGNEAVTAFTINRDSLINLTVTRLAGSEPKQLYLVVRKDWPELVSMLNKGLDSITREERETIRNKWVALKVEKHVDYKLIVQGAAITLVIVTILIIWNVQIRRQHELLRLSQERFRILSEASFEGIVIHDMDTVLDFNQKAPAIFGLDPGEVKGRNILDFIAPEYHETAREKMKQHSSDFYQIEGVHPDGSRFPIEVRGKELPCEDGRTVRIVAIRDITERKLMEDALKAGLAEKEMLLREMNHRIKNNLVVIKSLLRLHARQMDSQEAQGAIADIQGRIHSIGLIHERLSFADNQTTVECRTYLRDLSTNVFRTFQADQARIRLLVDVPDIPVDVDILMPCGLIVNELLTNALKYAFPDGGAGEVYVGVRAEDDAIRSLTVSDTGIGLPADLSIEGLSSLGFQLVTSLAGQIGGTMDIDRNNGTRVTVTIKERFQEA